jgi:hypothetical protein
MLECEKLSGFDAGNLDQTVTLWFFRREIGTAEDFPSCCVDSLGEFSMDG